MTLINKKLYFGVEQEHFIFRMDNCVPENIETNLFFNDVLKNGFKVYEVSSAGFITSVVIDTEYGNLFIKNDCYTHILEISFPPLERIDDLIYLYIYVLSIINGSLSKYNLYLKNGAILDFTPSKFIYNWPVKDASRLDKLINRQIPLNNFSDHKFNAFICSTQVHLNILKPNIYCKLSKLYEYEYLFPLLFSNSKSYNGQSFFCARPLIWVYNFLPNYNFFAFPDKIANSIKSYGYLIKTSSNFIRDYSFIAPRQNLQTIEFRGGDSQNEINDIVEMIALRIGIYFAIDHDEDLAQFNVKEKYIHLCISGEFDKLIVEKHFQNISKVLKFLPYTFQKPLLSVLYRIHNLIY